MGDYFGARDRAGVAGDFEEGRICVDCVMYVEYGTVPDDPEIAAAISAVRGRWHVDCGQDGEYCGFSWRACDACGSTLGGDRHRAFLDMGSV